MQKGGPTMRKIAFLLFLVILLTVVLASCDKGGSPEPTAAPTEPQATEKPTDIREAYKDIECKKSNGYEKQYFFFDSTEEAFTIEIPQEWTLVSKDGGYSISRSGKAIGKIFNGVADDLSAWESVKDIKRTEKDVIKQRDIEMSASSEEFRYRFEFSFERKESWGKVTLICNYAEINDSVLARITSSAKVEQIGNSLYLDELSDAYGKEIAVLGNSFINSSSIGRMLDEISGEHFSVMWQSRGYATVATYIKDLTVMDDIRNGRYACVFICGFYSNDEVDNLGVLKEACDESDTELVVFPAHNEGASIAKAAAEKYGLKLLDWQGEINMFIEGGVDQWEFCVNDQHKHSTALGGYVGAQMIYRAICGDIPSLDSFNSVDKEQVRALLGDYAETGSVPLDIEARYFNRLR